MLEPKRVTAKHPFGPVMARRGGVEKEPTKCIAQGYTLYNATKCSF